MMKKTFAVFVAALGLVASAAEQKHSWFDLDIQDIGATRDWPTDGSDYEAYLCSVTNTAAGQFSSAPNRVCFDTETPMAVVPNDSAPITDVSYALVSVTMKMEPFSESGLPEVPEDAKTAVIAVDSGNVTNFWVAAGAETLFWTNTLIAADLTQDVEAQVLVNFGVSDIVTQWTFGGARRFVCRAPKVAELQGVSLTGKGELLSCWGDAQAVGELVTFYLEGIPDEVVVTVTTTNGSEIVMSDEGVYSYARGGTLNLDFSLPDGWRFSDGREVWTDVIVGLTEGPYVPFAPMGLSAMDFGPTGGWMTVTYEGAVERFADLDDAMAALKDNVALMACYSEVPHEMTVSEDGRSLTVDGVSKPVGPHYHFQDVGGGLTAKFINEEEADVTSIAEDADDPTAMSVGSVAASYSGFGYSVLFADDPGFTRNVGATEPVRGNGEKLELWAPKGGNGSRFYRIIVTDSFTEE